MFEYFIPAFVLLSVLSAAIKIVREYERGVIFRLGRLVGAKGPGLFLIIPVIDKMVKVDLRTVTLDVPTQEVITKDNVPTKVNAVVYFRILDSENAIVEVEDYLSATSLISQTSLRSILGQSELDELLSERDQYEVAGCYRLTDRPLGHKGIYSRSKGCGAPGKHEEGNGKAGRGREGEEGEDNQCRGRVSGGRKTGKRSRDNRQAPGSAPAEIPANSNGSHI